MKKQLLLLFISSFIFFNLFSSDSRTDEFEIRYIKESIHINTDLQHQLRNNVEWQLFLDIPPNWYVYFNENNSLPHRAFGEGFFVSSISDFVANDLTMFDVPFSDLNLISGFEELVISKFMDSNDNAWNLPWWVDDSDRGVFLGFSEYERGLYYWCQTNKFTKSSSKLPNVFSVSFENFINDILIKKHDIFNFLEIKGSSMTNVVELELSKYKNISDVDDSSYNIENLLKIKYKEIVKENYG